MPPGLGLILFGGLGYVLVYAAVANSGRFATQPWAGLLEDAYTGNRSTATAADAAAPPAATQTRSRGTTLVSNRTTTRRARQTGSLA